MPDEFENVKVSDIYKEILHLKKFYNEEIKKAMQKIEVISTTSGITLEEQEKIVADYNGRLSGLYAIQYYIDYKSGNLNPYDGEWYFVKGEMWWIRKHIDTRFCMKAQD